MQVDVDENGLSDILIAEWRSPQNDCDLQTIIHSNSNETVARLSTMLNSCIYIHSLHSKTK